MTEETPIADYAADADVAQKKRGRPAKAAEVTIQTVVEDAPAPAPEAPAVYISEQTKLEMEAGRKAIGLK